MNEDVKRREAPSFKSHNDTETPNPIPFYLLHVSALAAIFTGVHAADLWLCLGLYLLRMFGVTAGYHRYFAHKSFKTSRVFQFILAFIAQTSAQRGSCGGPATTATTTAFPIRRKTSTLRPEPAFGTPILAG